MAVLFSADFGSTKLTAGVTGTYFLWAFCNVVVTLVVSELFSLFSNCFVAEINFECLLYVERRRGRECFRKLLEVDKTFFFFTAFRLMIYYQSEKNADFCKLEIRNAFIKKFLGA